jgi:putative SOS response-associated peptidase YedK
MCGRYVLDRNSPDLVALFDVDVLGTAVPGPSWNIAPTQSIAVVIDSLSRPTAAEAAIEGFVPEPVRRLEGARWGLVPSFAKDPSGPPLFNARSEDAATKPSFREAVTRRRAVIPVSGYYEWHQQGGEKTPMYVSLPGDELLLVAGLYEWWRNPAAPEGSTERWLLSATMLTRESGGALAQLHPRMPVFLDADLVEEWLDPMSEGSQELIDEVAYGAAEVAERAEFHEVGTAVGAVANNDPSLVAPV